MVAADLSVRSPLIDPVPAAIGAERWRELSAGLVQRARLLDALHADLYGPRASLASGIAPTAALLADPAYLRTAVGMPARGPRRLFALTSWVELATDGTWSVREEHVDVPEGVGATLEMRRALSRSAPALYRSTPLQRLHPFFDGIRSGLHRRARAGGRLGRVAVLTAASDAGRAFDQHRLATLLGVPVVTAGDLVVGAPGLSLRRPGAEGRRGIGARPPHADEDPVDLLIRMVPSERLDPLDLEPTDAGITGLVEAARCGDVEILNPLGAGLLESPALREAMPDLCRILLHEDLRLGSAPTAPPALWPSLDPSGGETLVGRPLRLQLMAVAGPDGFEVVPGGVARTTDAGPEALKDLWVGPAATSTTASLSLPAAAAAADAGPSVDAPSAAGPSAAGLSGIAQDATAQDDAAQDDARRPDPRASDGERRLRAAPAITLSLGSDLFWFGRYLERVDATARILRTMLDVANDLGAEQSPSARTALAVLLRAVTDVTTTAPGFHEVDLHDPKAVRRELESLLTETGRPGSLAQSAAALVRTARPLRDLISDSVWPTISRLRARIRGLGGTEQPLETELSAVVDGCLTLSGAIADSMPRALGWDLLECGRRIERATSLLTLLPACLGRRRSPAVEARVVGAIASITESGASYRRVFRTGLHPELLLELLLVDASLPRSIGFQLDRLASSAARLPEDGAALVAADTASAVAAGDAGAFSVGPSLEVRSELAHLRAQVAGWDPAALLTTGPGDASVPLRAEADEALDALRRLAAAIEESCFRSADPVHSWGRDDA
ncbi:circularly permuted type 2 ATP-grasp protein [Brachybacterium sp. DNPG3]